MKFNFSFIKGHHYLSSHDVSLNINQDESVVHEYEKKIVGEIGPGQFISFASGRMAFYAILKAWELKEGDEVILPAMTCSVMANTIWRCGLKPVFSDIDPLTYGSSISGIQSKVTDKTKVVVVQHTFGIPADIESVILWAQENNIKVVEDCALSYGSELNDKKVGDFGDAAIFSTDHSKPLNTLIGGGAYSRNTDLIQKIRLIRDNSPNLKKSQQKKIRKQILIEKRNLKPDVPGVKVSLLSRIINKLGNLRRIPVFLEDDYNRNSESRYPYPAKLPPFLAGIGILELERWQKEKENRIRILHRYIEIMNKAGLSDEIPAVYFDASRKIVPLRFVFSSSHIDELIENMKEFLDINWIWWLFSGPVVCVPDGLSSIGYNTGSCLVSEQVASSIFQLPCVIESGYENELFSRVEAVFSALGKKGIETGEI